MKGMYSFVLSSSGKRKREKQKDRKKRHISQLSRFSLPVTSQVQLGSCKFVTLVCMAQGVLKTDRQPCPTQVVRGRRAVRHKAVARGRKRSSSRAMASTRPGRRGGLPPRDGWGPGARRDSSGPRRLGAAGLRTLSAHPSMHIRRFKSINYSVLSFLHSSTLTSIHLFPYLCTIFLWFYLSFCSFLLLTIY